MDTVTLALAKSYTKGAVAGLLDVGLFHTDAEGNLMMEIDEESTREFSINENGELEVRI